MKNTFYTLTMDAPQLKKILSEDTPKNADVTPKIQPTKEISEEQSKERQQIFADKYGAGLKQFAEIKGLWQSLVYLKNYGEFLCEDGVIYMRTLAEKLAEEQKFAEMTLTLRQCQTLQFILDLSRELKADLGTSIIIFYERISKRDSEYYANFRESLEKLSETTFKVVKRKIIKQRNDEQQEVNDGEAKSEKSKQDEAKIEEMKSLATENPEDTASGIGDL